MRNSREKRRAVAALLVSALLHGLALWLVPLPEPGEERMVRVRFPARVKPERFELTPPVPVPRQLLDRLRSEARPPDLETVASTDSVVVPETEIPMPVEEGAFAEEVKPRVVSTDTLDRRYDLFESASELPSFPDLVELDAVGRERTVVLIDPDTGKLKKAYLHLPAWRNRPEKYHGTGVLFNTLDLIRRGFRISRKVPVEERIHLYPYRYKLNLNEIKNYPVVLLAHIGVESYGVLAQYLVMGGFAAGADLSSLQMHLSRMGERAEIVKIELGHPLFHAFFDITEYRDGGVCPAVGPLNALQLHSRLAAIGNLPYFRTDVSCPSNKMYVNAIAFGLIQHSRMGGRYISE